MRGANLAGSDLFRRQIFLQTRDQFDEIAGLVADIKLVNEDIVPGVLAGTGRAG